MGSETATGCFHFLLLCCVDAARASTHTDTSIHMETQMYTKHTVYHTMHMHAWHYRAPTQTHGCMASHSAHTNDITWRTHTPAFMTSHMCTPASKTPHTAHIYMCDATLHKYMCMALQVCTCVCISHSIHICMA